MFPHPGCLRASSSRKITLLQQPANTRPTAKAGRMAGAGAGEQARRRRPPMLLTQESGTEHRHGPGARLLPGAAAVPPCPEAATYAASRGAVVLSQPRPHSSEGASKSRPDYISQHSARSYARAGRVAPPQRSEGEGYESLARSAAARGLPGSEVSTPSMLLGRPENSKGGSFTTVTKTCSRCTKTTDL